MQKQEAVKSWNDIVLKWKESFFFFWCGFAALRGLFSIFLRFFLWESPITVYHAQPFEDEKELSLQIKE